MLILSLRTDKPEAEVGLHDAKKQIGRQKWQAHRQLSSSLHLKLASLLEAQHKTLQDVEGLVVFKGPGSFTGLRIGISVANALAYALQIPIVGSCGNHWQRDGIVDVLAGKNEKIVVPEYGAPVHTTISKH